MRQTAISMLIIIVGALRHEVLMDLWTKSLLGITAVAVLGYFGIVYGSCALDPRCHLRACPHGRYTCGVIHDRDGASVTAH